MDPCLRLRKGVRARYRRERRTGRCESLVEIHLLKAVPQDDPSNPNYDTITVLKRLRDSTSYDSVDDEIARLNPDDTLPMYHIVRELRRADDLIRSKKEDDHEKGQKLDTESDFREGHDANVKKVEGLNGYKLQHLRVRSGTP